MKNFLKKLAVSFLFIHLALTASVLAAAAPTATGDVNSPIETLQQIGGQTELPAFNAEGQHADAPADYLTPGLGTVSSPILFVIDLLRYLASGIAMIIVVKSAIQLVATSTEDQATKAKNTLLWSVLGLVLIQLADVIVKRMFFGTQGEAFEDAATAELFAEQSISQIRGVIGFIQVFIGAVAVLVLIVRGFTLLSTGGDEEAIGKAKSQIIYAVAGLIVIGLSEVVVRGFIFPENGQALPDQQVGTAILVTLTNFISGFVAIFSFAALFYAGYRYVTAGGNEEVTETVKKTATGAVIGLVLSLGAFAIVNTFVTLEARPDEQVDPNAGQQEVIENQP